MVEQSGLYKKGLMRPFQSGRFGETGRVGQACSALATLELKKANRMCQTGLTRCLKARFIKADFLLGSTAHSPVFYQRQAFLRNRKPWGTKLFEVFLKKTEHAGLSCFKKIVTTLPER
ncbi:hypothetical protein [Bartonella apihabitans]|uniref:hypothetical protein n=1 Tax=Bartonella apihabitans TaxID=2750929 RepID=UPI003BB806A8